MACVSTKQTKVYKLKNADKILSLISENEGFITPQKGLKALYLNNQYKEKIHKQRDLYMYKNNYLLRNKEILNEKQAIIKFLKN